LIIDLFGFVVVHVVALLVVVLVVELVVLVAVLVVLGVLGFTSTDLDIVATGRLEAG
jgi:hypothetical protein